MITQEQIQNLSDDIVRNFNPEKIILFGSHAYGTPKDWSDADLLVVMQFEGHPLEKMADIIYTVHPKIDIDLLVRTEEMIERRPNIGDPFMQEITSKGTVLYQKANA
jgi:predicted nucleotidyltransferase